MGNRIDPWRLFHIANFYTDLTLKMFGGTKKDASHDIGDIENHELDARIEVKGRSNEHLLDIFSNQLTQAIDGKGFGFHNHVYAIYSYRNSWRNSSRRLTNMAKSREEMDEFLAKNTIHLFFVDADVLAAIREERGLRYARRAGEDAPIINMSKRVLLFFIQKPKETLQKYGLKNFRVFLRGESLIFRDHKISFLAIFVLRQGLMKKLLSNCQAVLFPQINCR